MPVAGTLVVKMAADVAELRRGMDQARTVVARFESSLGSIAGTLKGIGTGFSLAVLAREFLQTANAVTLMENKLRIVSDSQEQARNTMQQLFEIAQRTRTSWEANVALFSRIAQSSQELGQSRESLLAFTETVQQAARVSGVTGEEVRAAVQQLGQALASGRLQGDELRSILENFPRLGKAIADGMGVSIGALREMGKEGQLTAERVYAAINKEAPKIAEEFKKLPITMSEAMTKLGNSAQLMVGNIDRATGVTRELAGTINDLAREVASTNIAGPLARMMQSLGLDDVKFEGWGKLSSLIVNTVNEVSDLADWFQRLGKQLEIFWNDMEQGWQRLIVFVEQFKQDAANAIIGWLQASVDALNKLIGEINALLSSNRVLRAIWGSEPIPPIRIQFETVGLESLQLATAELERLRQVGAALQGDLDRMRTQQSQAALSGAIGPPPELPDLHPSLRAKPPPRRPPPGGGGGKGERAAERAAREEVRSREKAMEALARQGEEMTRLREQYESLLVPTARFTEQIGDMDKALSRGVITQEEHAAAVEKIGESWHQARLEEMWGPDAVAAVEGFGKAIEGLGTSIYDSFFTAGFSIREFTAGFLRDMGRMVFQMMVWTPIIRAFMNIITGWVTGPAGGTASAGAGVSPQAVGVAGGRQGGGAVWPGAAFVVGEQGPERFIPNVPGRIEPMGGGDTVVNISIMGVESGRGNSQQEAAQLARKVRAAVLDILRNEKRPGGMMAEGAS